MLTEYGHAEIEWQGVKYRLVPSFANIAKIGTPKGIIEDFKFFMSTSSDVYRFDVALNIVNSCCEPKLPLELTGSVDLINGKLEYIKPDHDLPMLHDIMVFAEHCLVHGICGKTNKKPSRNAKPLQEFDAYSFMESARIHLEFSATEASNMTMTEFIRLINAKFPKDPDSVDLDDDAEDELLEWFNNQNGVK